MAIGGNRHLAEGEAVFPAAVVRDFLPQLRGCERWLPARIMDLRSGVLTRSSRHRRRTRHAGARLFPSGSCGRSGMPTGAQRGGRTEMDLQDQHDAGPAHQAAKVNTQTGVAGRQAFRVRREPGGEEA